MKKLTEVWVADDGSYGSGQLEIFDTSAWSEAEIEELDDASDSERLETAREIASRHSV